MMTTIKNAELEMIVNFSNSAEAFVNRTDLKFPVRFTWNWRKNIKKIRELYDEMTKLRNEINESYMDDKYSFDDEQGQRMVKTEYIAEYQQKVNDLYEQENEVEIAMVSLDDLGETELSIPEMEAISFMIEE